MSLCKWDWMLWLDNCPFASRYLSKKTQVFGWNEKSWKLQLFGYLYSVWKQLVNPISIPSAPCKVWAELFPLMKSSLRAYKHPHGFWSLRQGWALQQHARQREHHPLMNHTGSHRLCRQGLLSRWKTRMKLGASLAKDSNVLLKFKHMNSCIGFNWDYSGA